MLFLFVLIQMHIQLVYVNVMFVAWNINKSNEIYNQSIHFAMFVCMFMTL